MRKQAAIPIIEGSIDMLVDSIMNEQFLERGKIRDKVTTFVVSAVATILESQINELEKEYDQLKYQISCGAFDSDKKLKFNKMFRLGSIKDELKYHNRSIHVVKDYSEYEVFKRWAREKFGAEAMQEFYDMQPEMKIALLKPTMEALSKQLVYKSKP